MKSEREGKLTLRTFKAENKPAPVLLPQEVLQVREQLHLSRPVFAHYLRTNTRTLENWEQGRAKPSAQASLLIRMVAHFPTWCNALKASGLQGCHDCGTPLNFWRQESEHRSRKQMWTGLRQSLQQAPGTGH